MTAVLDWIVAYLCRWLPRATATGLVPLGDPDESSPVLVTATFGVVVIEFGRIMVTIVRGDGAIVVVVTEVTSSGSGGTRAVN